jgi:hypothetical protein
MRAWASIRDALSLSLRLKFRAGMELPLDKCGLYGSLLSYKFKVQGLFLTDPDGYLL